MRRDDRPARFLPALALSVLLVAAHIAAALHGFDHDSVGPQAKTCVLCITAAQLGAACIDSGPCIDLEPVGYRHESSVAIAFGWRQSCPARQRGPPTSHHV